LERTEQLTPAYRAALAALSPIVRRWGRLEVSGLEHMPLDGPVLLAGNHDSYWDPLVIGIAALPRRQIHALAKIELWKLPGLGKVLDGMGQIPIDRGRGDAHALDTAVERLRGGKCIGVFLEGTRSLGRTLRARSGFGRLAEAVPEAQIVCCTVEGAPDIPRFPKRPRVRVRFFRPAALDEGVARRDLPVPLLAEIRASAAIEPAGRRRKAEERRRAAAAEHAKETV
jgi:1-acyl-sn-glycerol-3-phosphate acyltransferase